VALSFCHMTVFAGNSAIFAKYLQEFCSITKHVGGSLLHVLQVTGTHRETQRETNINRETQTKRGTQREGLGCGGGWGGRVPSPLLYSAWNNMFTVHRCCILLQHPSVVLSWTSFAFRTAS
jgi:hypothetical protein